MVGFQLIQPETQEPERAKLLALCQLFRIPLLRYDPWVPFPQNACCYGFGTDNAPLPLGALYRIWDRLVGAVGTCPACGDRVFTFAFGGLLNVGGLIGCCLGCGRRLQQPVGGLARVARHVAPALEKTPFFLNHGMFGGAVGGPRAPLVEALRHLGARALPSRAWVKEKEKVSVSLSLRRSTPESKGEEVVQ